MDEPTNHMDLPSIECLESALKDYQGGLLLMSHDTRFLSRLTPMGWDIQPDPCSEGDTLLHVSLRGFAQKRGTGEQSLTK